MMRAPVQPVVYGGDGDFGTEQRIPGQSGRSKPKVRPHLQMVHVAQHALIGFPAALTPSDVTRRNIHGLTWRQRVRMRAALLLTGFKQ